MADLKDLKTRYKSEIVPELKKSLGITNDMAVPKLVKVSINSGIGTYLRNHKDSTNIVDNLKAITGQSPILIKARKSVSNFKLREGSVVGAAVTLRGDKMYDFINKLVNIVFPRVRDFRGLSVKSFDGNGNYSIGFKEHTVFPEISPDDVLNIHGLQINITTSATDDTQAQALLRALGFPLQKTK